MNYEKEEGNYFTLKLYTLLIHNSFTFINSFFLIGVRLLSCETPDENNSIVFCDNIVGGMVISLNFFIRDDTARGFQMKFSIAVMEEDEKDISSGNYLLAKLNDITCILSQIIHRIQSDCYKNKEEEPIMLTDYPTIDYVNLHQQISSFLINLSEQDVSQSRRNYVLRFHLNEN